MVPSYIPKTRSSKLTLLATRGPISAACFEGDVPFFGDPALLVRECYSHFLTPTKKYRGGILLHHSQKMAPDLVAFLEEKNWVHISAATNDVESVIQKIAECEVLLSSSLHGLIVADALQIPNEWIQGNIHIASTFKFHDYASSIGRPLTEPITDISVYDLKRISDVTKARSRDYWRQIDRINRGLTDVLKSAFS